MRIVFRFPRPGVPYVCEGEKADDRDRCFKQEDARTSADSGRPLGGIEDAQTRTMRHGNRRAQFLTANFAEYGRGENHSDAWIADRPENSIRRPHHQRRAPDKRSFASCATIAVSSRSKPDKHLAAEVEILRGSQLTDEVIACGTYGPLASEVTTKCLRTWNRRR